MYQQRIPFMWFKSLFVSSFLVACDSFQVSAQDFTTLCTFSAASPVYPCPCINADRPTPAASLVLSSNTLYGTTLTGGSSDNGAVFSINTDGTVFTNLYIFFSGGDEAHPYAGLVRSGTTLFGNTANGGGWGRGTVFAINTDGTALKVELGNENH